MNKTKKIMSLNELRTEKIMSLNELKKEIKQQKNKIWEEECKLNELNKKYDEESSISELPILLFTLKKDPYMEEGSRWGSYLAWKRQYIYYYPDFDEINEYISVTNCDFLPNTIDLREQFEELVIQPKEYYPYPWAPNYVTCDTIDYSPIIMQAKDALKSQIDALFNSNDINSWTDLKIILENEFQKGHSKILTSNNTQK